VTLSLEDLVHIERVLDTTPAPAVVEAAAALRTCLPGMKVLTCDAADMIEEPFRSYGGVEVHLLDTSDHCVAVTSDLRRANGVLLAAGAPA
jgi:hypothetical protein